MAIDFSRSVQFYKGFLRLFRHDEENWDATPQCTLGTRIYSRIRVEYKIPRILICISYLFVNIYPRTSGSQVWLVLCLYRGSYYFHSKEQRARHKQGTESDLSEDFLPSFCNQINKRVLIKYFCAVSLNLRG